LIIVVAAIAVSLYTERQSGWSTETFAPITDRSSMPSSTNQAMPSLLYFCATAIK
jgi:hypothetical protein